MPERTAAEVLAEKLKAAWSESVRQPCRSQTMADRIEEMAAALAQDPAITVRTDMEVERFVIERHHRGRHGSRAPEDIHRVLTSGNYFVEGEDLHIIVHPYPESG